MRSRDEREDYRIGNIARASREGLWIVLGQAASLAGLLVSVRVLTELMEPTQYGQLALGLAIATIVTQILLGPLSQAAMRFYAPSNENGDLATYYVVLKQLAFAAIILSLCLLLVGVALLKLLQLLHWYPVFVSAMFLAIVVGLNSVFNGFQNAARRRAIVALHQGAQPWTRLALAIFAIYAFGPRSEHVLAAYLVAGLIIIGSQMAFARGSASGVDGQASTEYVKLRRAILSYSWPFSLWGIFYWAQSASDRWSLELFRSSDEVGLYAVLFQLGYYPVTVLTGFVVQLVAPILYERVGAASDQGRRGEVKRATFGIAFGCLILTAIGCSLAGLLHETVFQLLVAAPYAKVSDKLPWFVSAGGIFATAQLISIKLMSDMRTRALLPMKIGTAIIGVLGNLVGAYFFGIDGVILSLNAFGIICVVWVFLLASNEDEMKNGFEPEHKHE